MTPVAFAIIIFGIVGVAMGWAGYAIGFQRRYHLIAGFEPRHLEQMRDPDALGRWVGNGSLSMAALCAVAIIALLVAPGAAPVIVTVAGIAGGAAGLVCAAGSIGRGR